MKFPRNARIFRGHLDIAPFAGVFFLLVVFLLLACLVYTPGYIVHLSDAPADQVSGVAGPMVAVAIDPNGQLYFENEPVQKDELKRRLYREAQKYGSEPMTLVLMADKAVTHDLEVQLTTLVRSDPRLHIHDILVKTLPRVLDASNRDPMLQ